MAASWRGTARWTGSRGWEKKGEGEGGRLFIVTPRPDGVLYSLIRAQRSPREARFYSREILRFRAKQNRKTRKLVFREDLDARIRICVWYTAFRMMTRNDDERLSRKLGPRYRCVIRALLSVNMKVHQTFRSHFRLLAIVMKIAMVKLRDLRNDECFSFAIPLFSAMDSKFLRLPFISTVIVNKA